MFVKGSILYRRNLCCLLLLLYFFVQFSYCKQRLFCMCYVLHFSRVFWQCIQSIVNQRCASPGIPFHLEERNSFTLWCVGTVCQMCVSQVKSYRGTPLTQLVLVSLLHERVKPTRAILFFFFFAISKGTHTNSFCYPSRSSLLSSRALVLSCFSIRSHRQTRR